MFFVHVTNLRLGQTKKGGGFHHSPQIDFSNSVCQRRDVEKVVIENLALRKHCNHV